MKRYKKIWIQIWIQKITHAAGECAGQEQGGLAADEGEGCDPGRGAGGTQVGSGTMRMFSLVLYGP